jgi:hypothetical protein
MEQSMPTGIAYKGFRSDSTIEALVQWREAERWKGPQTLW